MSHFDARTEHLLAAGAVSAAGGALVAGHHHEDDGADEDGQQGAHHHGHDDDHQPHIRFFFHQALQLRNGQVSQLGFVFRQSTKKKLVSAT